MLIFSILSLLLSNAVVLRRDTSILYNRVAILILLVGSLLIYNNLYTSFFFNGISLYAGLFYFENYTLVFTIFINILSIFILTLTSFYSRYKLASEGKVERITTKREYISQIGEQYKIIEYPLIILFCLAGAIFLISSSDIISIFLSIELQSYGLYLICSIYRNSEESISAGLTYFLLGGLSSCIILLGQSLLYVNSGNTSLDNIYIIKSISDGVINNNINIGFINDTYLYYIQFSLIIMSVGFLFKISAAPFHFWSPDVYDAIPTVVTTFVAIIAKVSILIFLLELVYYTSSSLFKISWLNNLVLSSMLSLIIGSILGLTQYRIKRLYAYSTISHIGFILLALSINNIESMQAFFFYIMQYSITNLNAFIILIAIGTSLYYHVSIDNDIYRNLKDRNNSPIQLISQLKGYVHVNPYIAISLGITLFSFIGVPPLIGFFGKQMILSAALDNGYVFITFIAIITSVISAVYYLVLIKSIFFEVKSYNEKREVIGKNSIVGQHLSLTISILTLLIILFLFFDQEWLRLIHIITFK
jgi:NADH-ubiquinone oxidoreductase chain 2